MGMERSLISFKAPFRGYLPLWITILKNSTYKRYKEDFGEGGWGLWSNGVSDEELARRKAAYVQPEPNVKSGWLARYARMVASANLGAVMQ